MYIYKRYNRISTNGIPLNDFCFLSLGKNTKWYSVLAEFKLHFNYLMIRDFII